MRQFKNVCEAYYFVYDHPKLQFGGFAAPNIEVTPHMVNPISRFVEDDPELNTQLDYWVECGAWVETESFGVQASHDWELDCGGSSYEEAIYKLAALVERKYGDYDDLD